MGVVILAATVQSATGFGFSIAAVPLLSGMFGVHDGIVLNLALSLINSIGVTTRTRRDLDRETVVPLVIGGVLGLVPGIAVFALVNVHVLKVAIAIIVLVAALLLLVGVQVPLRRHRGPASAAGVISGLLAGSVGLAGPPVVVYLSSIGTAKGPYRATLSRYFTCLYAVLVPAHIILAGSVHILTWAVFLFPGIVLGSLVGQRAFSRVNQRWFDRTVVLVVVAAGLTVLWSG